MRIEIPNITGFIVGETENKAIKRNGVALSYRIAMNYEHNGWQKVDWHRVNTAIIKRWSMSGLIYIKERAHKLALEYE